MAGLTPLLFSASDSSARWSALPPDGGYIMRRASGLPYGEEIRRESEDVYAPGLEEVCYWSLYWFMLLSYFLLWPLGLLYTLFHLIPKRFR